MTTVSATGVRTADTTIEIALPTAGSTGTLPVCVVEPMLLSEPPTVDALSPGTVVVVAPAGAGVNGVGALGHLSTVVTCLDASGQAYWGG
jgi:hypothetical protein